VVIFEEQGSSAPALFGADWLIWFLFAFDFAVDLRFGGSLQGTKGGAIESGTQ
jgi:hypothetical protein